MASRRFIVCKNPVFKDNELSRVFEKPERIGGYGAKASLSWLVAWVIDGL
jgi:hypothetical protein